MVTIKSKDYYCKEQFRNPKLEFVRSNYENFGRCPFCGGDLVAVSSYVFRNKDTGELQSYTVQALYGVCESCGAI